MQFPVMVVTNEGKNLISEAVQSGNKIKFEEVIISVWYISNTLSIADMEAITYDDFMEDNPTKIRGNASKVTLQTDDEGKSFINVSGEIFPNGVTIRFTANTLAITARIGSGPIKLFGISRTSGAGTTLTFGESGTTKIHVSANISTASVGGNIIAYTFDSNYVAGDDFDLLSQTLRSDVEVAKRSDLANRHYYSNPIDAIRYSSPMNSFKLRSGLYPELSLHMMGNTTQEDLRFKRFEHERYSLALGHSDWEDDSDPQICVSGRFIKADGTVVVIRDRLNHLTPIETSTLYQDTFQGGRTWVSDSDLLVSYDDETLDTELILAIGGDVEPRLVASINPRTGVMNWMKEAMSRPFTPLGYLDIELSQDSTFYFQLYKNASHKQDVSRIAYTWTDRELAPGRSFDDVTAILGIALFNNEPYLIMEYWPDTAFGVIAAVPHDLVNGPSEGFTILQTPSDTPYRLVRCMSNYLIFRNVDDGFDTYVLVSPFKSVPDAGNYTITENTVITDYGYRQLDSTSEFDATPSDTTPNGGYTLLCQQWVDNDIKYVVCNGRLIPHID